MPFKCTQCNTVVQDNELQDCPCESNHFVKCATIHLIHPEGLGLRYSSSQKIAKHDKETRANIALNIACTDVVDKTKVQCTVYGPLITCPKCLQFMEDRRPSNTTKIVDKPLDTDKLDISPEELQTLKQLGLDPETST